MAGSGPGCLFVPSLANPAHILDLSQQTSLIQFIQQGYLLDWGELGDEER